MVPEQADEDHCSAVPQPACEPALPYMQFMHVSSASPRMALSCVRQWRALERHRMAMHHCLGLNSNTPSAQDPKRQLRVAKRDRCAGPSHSEQMSAIEARTDAEAGEAPAVGGKRKAGGKGAAGARKKGPGAGALNTHVRSPLGP